MSLIKKGISALLLTGLIMSCDDDGFTPIAPQDDFVGSTTAELTSFSIEASGDGTIVTVKPLSVGVDSYEIDFGNGDTPSTALQGESATYDYPNADAFTDYTITVTTISAGQANLSKSEEITVEHTVQTVDNAPSSPEGKLYNLLNLFTDASAFGSEGTGGKAVALESGNNLLEFSRLHSDTGIFGLSNEVVAADAFYSGVGSNDIHFDVYTEFAAGIDKLKITLIDSTNSTNHVIDDIDLIDGEWASLDFNLATDFSSPVSQYSTILFELGTNGTANDHATITVDNIYMSRMTGSTIVNGDFEDGTDFWKWTTFTDGTTNPFGSSSDGSNLDYDGNLLDDKTRGAKWSASQSAGDFNSADSRYAYQELNLVPGADYILEYQYAIKDDSGADPVGGRKVVGLILDGHYDDGADAVENLGQNLGFDEGFIAEGKFSDTTGDIGTLVQLPFTANASGEVAIMFYAVTPQDAFIDNVRVRSVNP